MEEQNKTQTSPPFKPRRHKKIDYILLILFPLLATALSLFFRVDYLILILLFFGLPALYFSLRNRKIGEKTIIFSLIAAIPIAIIMDYICTLNNAWIVPTTVFPFRLFGIVPIEDIIWMILTTFSILTIYEFFINKTTVDLLHRKMIYLIILLAGLFILFLLMVSVFHYPFHLKYSYLWTSICLFFVPTVLFFFRYPKKVVKFLNVSVYFFFVILLMEITGLTLRHWIFTGTDVIGWINLFGCRFPFEEFFFLIMIGPLAALSYYEFFDNNN